jgi:hypothetical protein
MFVRPLTVMLSLFVGRVGCGADPFPAAEELMAADRAFAEASAARGAEVWSEVWAEQGLLYGDGTAAATGPSAASAGVAAIVDELRWEPTQSAMLWPGLLGHTVGAWWMRSDPHGRRHR